ncbi:Uncharacterized protein MCB1EB_1801 [Mycoavidus cysteinexigens]|uniref:Uncharacterized protein n=1 Tax=Mycoavidus cysteinexigens TaxID=1553431 RepID=A0A2Z6EX37_9BURK|nr:hypothetical protein [Mycoavidus cysteinexigens]BBE09962.1 Uncharacterized protein MCB1EB_1801 [Mycoavidus cysteinexigens]GLR00402.1 hypothetical protein GCM10007934_02130 [Mycoavidus cysteinexigens]
MKLNFTWLSQSIEISGGQLGTSGTASIRQGLGCPQLSKNSGDSWGQTQSTEKNVLQRSPILSPVSPELKNGWGQDKASVDKAVPIVPDVPTQKSMNEIDREAFEERAAIMEFDGELSRAEAERLAIKSLEEV